MSMAEMPKKHSQALVLPILEGFVCIFKFITTASFYFKDLGYVWLYLKKSVQLGRL